MRRSRSPRNGLEVICERREGTITAFSVVGHAGFADAGQDIVCAAVSALVLSAANGLRRHCRAKPKVSDTPAEFHLELPSGANVRAQAVLESMVSGLEAIAESYPGYIRLRQNHLAGPGPGTPRAKARA